MTSISLWRSPIASPCCIAAPSSSTERPARCRPTLRCGRSILAASEPLLSVRGVHTYYGDSYVLHGLSLELQLGRIICILGRNGMGKTTLIRTVGGRTPPRRG